MSRLSSACARAATVRAGGARDGEAVEPERDSVRVAEPPEQPEAPLEERPCRSHLPGDHEVQREPVERPRDARLVAEALVDGERLSKERLCLRVVPARPCTSASPVYASATPLASSSERESSSASRQSVLGAVVVALVVREDAVPAQRAGAGRRCLG